MNNERLADFFIDQGVMDRAQAGPVGGDIQSVRQFVHRIIGGVLPRYSHGQNHFDPLVSPVTFSHGDPPLRLRDQPIGQLAAAL